MPACLFGEEVVFMNVMTEKELLDFFPEISMIEKAEWRRAVTEIWLEAYSTSAYSSLSEAGFHVNAPRCGLVVHTRAVTLSALDLAKHTQEVLGIAVDRDKLLVLCLLHDVCKLLEMEPDPESARGAVRKTTAGRWYQHGFLSGYFALKHGLPEDIVGLLVAHTDKSSVLPDTAEGICMYYADEAMADQAFKAAGAKLIMRKFKP